MLLLLLLKKVGSARLRESDIHPVRGRPHPSRRQTKEWHELHLVNHTPQCNTSHVNATDEGEVTTKGEKRSESEQLTTETRTRGSQSSSRLRQEPEE